MGVLELSRRSEIVSWCLYDFANSFYAAVVIATVWAAYYANEIVGNQTGAGDLWWGRVVSFSMLAVALTSPIAGALADFAALRKKLLIAYTLLSVAGTALLVTVAPGMIVYGFVLTVVANFGFEGAMVFYNAYLPILAEPGHQGRLSGWGFATGYAGSLVGLALALPLVQHGRMDLAFLMVAACFLVFSLPAFFALPRDERRSRSFRESAVLGLRGSWNTLKEIAARPALRRFLLAYFVYIDGINTVIYFSSIFAAHTLGFSMSELLVVFLVVQCSALVGALAWAKPTDRLGPKYVVLLMLVQWVAVVVGAYFVTSKIQFFVLAAAAGTGLGAVQASSRALLSRMIPPARAGEFFGFYALSGKTASVLGPLVFGLVSVASGGNQRLSVLSVLAFLLVGGGLLLGVKADGPAAPVAVAADGA
jgi:UMF1 family MFS transporter